MISRLGFAPISEPDRHRSALIDSGTADSYTIPWVTLRQPLVS